MKVIKFDLEPCLYKAGSYHGKARVVECGSEHTLYSYGVECAKEDKGKIIFADLGKQGLCLPVWRVITWQKRSNR